VNYCVVAPSPVTAAAVLLWRMAVMILSLIFIMMILYNTHILPELHDMLALAKALEVAVGYNAA